MDGPPGIGYTNAFTQAEIKEQVYVEHPKEFENLKGKFSKVLFLLKSLYLLKQTPRTYFEKLRDGLLERGVKQSD